QRGDGCGTPRNFAGAGATLYVHGRPRKARGSSCVPVSDHPTRPVRAALTIAGSDSSGGAGIQADLKTFAALGVYGTSVITAVTAQNTKGVRAIHALPAEFVASQLDAVFEDLAIGATKIGMLWGNKIIAA